jgi:uncharacterized protein
MSHVLIRRWRRLDEPGLEIFRLVQDAAGYRAASIVTFAGKQSFALRYDWSIDSAWQTRAVRMEVMGEGGDRSLEITRSGPASWRVNGEARADLEGCDEVDLSATPFCNSLAIPRIRGATGELTTLYIDAPELSITPARQRYEQLAERRWRFTFLPTGFVAEIQFDEHNLVRHYEGLAEAF